MARTMEDIAPATGPVATTRSSRLRTNLFEGGAVASDGSPRSSSAWPYLVWHVIYAGSAVGADSRSTIVGSAGFPAASRARAAADRE